MKLQYLSTAEPGLRWMRAHFRRDAQLDLQRAAASLRTAETVLRNHPAAGRRFEDFETVREYLIQGTSFSLLYTVAHDTVWIIDIRDQRGQRSAEALEQFLRVLRTRGVD
jgi:plasmid stabilization system protein ParE